MRITLSTLAASFLASTLALVAAAPQEGAAPAKASIGQPAPVFTLKGADGKTYNLADYKGKTVVLEWFCATCPVSGNGDNSYWGSGRASKTIAAVTVADASAVYLSIDSSKNGTPESSKAVVTTAGQSTPMLMDTDGKVGRAYGAKTTPHVFIVDGAGNVAYIGAPGSDDGKTDYIVNAVTALKSGKPVEPATTKNKGCGIKYASKG